MAWTGLPRWTCRRRWCIRDGGCWSRRGSVSGGATGISGMEDELATAPVQAGAAALLLDLRPDAPVASRGRAASDPRRRHSRSLALHRLRPAPQAVKPIISIPM